MPDPPPTLSCLQTCAGQWVSRPHLRAMAMAAGLRDTGLLDFSCKSLDGVVLDGWAVYREQHPEHKVGGGGGGREWGDEWGDEWRENATVSAPGAQGVCEGVGGGGETPGCQRGS